MTSSLKILAAFTPVVPFHEIFVTKIMNKLIYYYCRSKNFVKLQNSEIIFFVTTKISWNQNWKTAIYCPGYCLCLISGPLKSTTTCKLPENEGENNLDFTNEKCFIIRSPSNGLKNFKDKKVFKYIWLFLNRISASYSRKSFFRFPVYYL